MPFDPCNPCGCIPANIDDRLFHQMATNLLCGILEAVQGGGGVAENVNVSAWGGVATTLGQKAMAASVPVVIASDQSPVDTNVAEFGGVATSLGQKLKAASIPVVIASDQGAAANAVVSITTAAGVGATTAGIRSLSIANVGSASGTVDGDTFQAGSVVELTAIWDPVTQTFLKVPAISYDATGTSYRIVEVA